MTPFFLLKGFFDVEVESSITLLSGAVLPPGLDPFWPWVAVTSRGGPCGDLPAVDDDGRPTASGRKYHQPEQLQLALLFHSQQIDEAQAMPGCEGRKSRFMIRHV